MQYIVTKCLWCDKHLIEPGDLRQPRSDKKFCSDRCRGKFNYWHKALAKREKEAVIAVAALADYLQHPIAQQEAVNALVRIREKIKDEFGWNSIKAVK